MSDIVSTVVGLHIALGFATAAAFSLVLIPILVRLCSVYGLYDLPDGSTSRFVATRQVTTPATLPGPRKIHSVPIPRLGGIAIFISFFVTNFIWSYDTPLKIPLAVSAAIFLIGLIDDLYPLSAKLRLGAQLTCALAAVHFGGLVLQDVALTSSLIIKLPLVLGYLLSAFVIVGAINSVNMIDGLDGLASGVVLIGVTLLSFAYFVRTHDANLLKYLTIPMIGAIIGFLRYNTYPASIFMGDSGSNWLGFMTGILILIVLGNQTLGTTGVAGVQLTASPQGAQHLPLISAILCLAIPVFDTACVMLSRLKDGLNPMSPDKRHFHHTLLNLGLSHSQSVSAVYFLALASGILGIIPVIFPQYNFVWVPYGVAGALLLLFIPMSVNASKATIEKISNYGEFWRQQEALGTQLNTLIRQWERINRYVLYGILLACPAFAGAVHPELGYAAGAAAALILLVTLIRRDRNDFFESISISLGAIVLLVCNNMNVMTIEFSGQRISIQPVYNALFIFLFISTTLMFFTTVRKRYFVFTPSDFLLLTIPMVMLLVPEPYRSAYRLDIICLRSLVVFMCLRTMVKRRRQSFYRMKMVTIAALVFVVLTGVWGMRIVY